MWRFRLIRFRLTLTYTLLLTGAFVLFSVGIFVALHQVLYDNFYNKVNQAADNVVKGVNVSVDYRYYPRPQINLHVTSETIGGDIGQSVTKTGFFNVNGQPIPGDQKGDPKLASNGKVKQAIQTALVKGANESVTLPGKNGDTAVVAIPLSSYGAQYVLLVQSSLQDVEDELSTLQRILIMSAVAVTVLSATGAWFLTGRLLRPIDQMAEKVRRITARDLSQRLKIDQPDEFGRLASTFDNMIARLQASFERQKRFSSDASHELRTPLAVMQADISLALRRPRSPAEYRHTLESAQEEVSRLSHIVSDLLTLTRLDTDSAQIAHEPVALDELIEGVVAGLRPLATEKSIMLTYAIDAPVTINGDIHRLKQLFLNLVDNALAYTPDGGRVHVGLNSTTEQVTVVVRDTGIGIEPQNVPHIFERFFRTDEARVRHHEGTGLGLAIVQSVTHAHRGTIEVASELGMGTTFTVYLPRESVLATQGDTVRLTWPASHAAVVG